MILFVVIIISFVLKGDDQTQTRVETMPHTITQPQWLKKKAIRIPFVLTTHGDTYSDWSLNSNLTFTSLEEMGFYGWFLFTTCLCTVICFFLFFLGWICLCQTQSQWYPAVCLCERIGKWDEAVWWDEALLLPLNGNNKISVFIRALLFRRNHNGILWWFVTKTTPRQFTTS